MRIRAGCDAACRPVFLLACLLVPLAAGAAPPKYRLTAIPRLDWDRAIPREINNSGHVVGWLVKDGQPLHTFLYKGGTTIDLQTAGGEIFSAMSMNDEGVIVGHIENQAFMFSNGDYIPLQASGYELTLAIDINDVGQITGSAVPPDDGPRQVFLYEEGNVSILPMGPFVSMSAAAISNTGTVIGIGDMSDGKNPERHPFIYRDGETIDMGSLGRHKAYPEAINDSGRVTGVLRRDPDHRNWHAFVRSRNGVMTELGTLGGNNSLAEDINSSGHVAGSAQDETNAYRAFLYKNGVMNDLGALGGRSSSASDITDNGQVVGNVELANATWTIFIYGVDGPRTYDLNALVDPADPLKPFVRLWQTSQQRVINEFGQILAVGDDGSGYIVSPVDSTPPVVTARVSGTQGGHGWYTSDVRVSWITRDPEAPVGARIGCTTATVTADSYGSLHKCQAASIGGTSGVNTVSIKRDSTAPSIAIRSPRPGAVFDRHQLVHVSYHCSDAPSGIESCTGSVPLSDLIDTSRKVTNAVFEVVAIDKAGIRSAVTQTYSVK